MLGVTLFGVFLTPVFFSMIEWFVESPLFSSQRARSIGRWLRIAMNVLSLGSLWLVTLLGRAFSRRPAVPSVSRRIPVGLNGDAEKRVSGIKQNGEAFDQNKKPLAGSASDRMGERPGD
jgi:hypothetical protein